MRDFLLETDIPAPTHILGRPFQSDFERVLTEKHEDGKTDKYIFSGILYRDVSGRIRKDVNIQNPNGTTVRLIIIQDILSQTVYMIHEEAKSVLALPLTDMLILNSGFATASHDEEIGERQIEGLLCTGYRGKRGEERVTTLWVSDTIGEALIEENTGSQESDVFRLFNIRLNEPDKSLFSIPAGYKNESLFS